MAELHLCGSTLNAAQRQQHLWLKIVMRTDEMLRSVEDDDLNMKSQAVRIGKGTIRR